MALYARGNPARWWKSRSCGGPSRAPGSLFISPLRRYSARTALAFLLLFFAALWYFTNPARISHLSEILLSRVLGGHVTVQSGRLSLTGTLLLSGVEVRTSEPEPTPASEIPIFSAEQIEVRFDWGSLLTGQLTATQLVATTPVFRPIEDRQTGHWNYERLRPRVAGTLPSGAKGEEFPKSLSLPVVVVRNARVEWGEVRGPLGPRVRQTGETMIEGQLTPDPVLPSTYRFQFTQRAQVPTAAGEGSQTRPDIGVALAGTWDVADNYFIATTENVVMSEALKRGMPRQAREWCEAHQLNGRLSQMKMTFSEREGLTLGVQFDDVSMVWMVEPEQGIAMGEERPSYPLTLNKVRGAVSFSMNNESMKISDLRGEVLGYQFIADCTVHGTSRDAPFEMNLRFPDAELGERYPALFMAFLSSQDLIQRVQPHGKMDIGISMKRLVPRGPATSLGTIDCHDVRMRFAHMPYPLDHLNGRVTFDHQSVTFHNVSGRSDDSVIRINGTVGTNWTNPMVDLTVSSDAVVFDDRLGACLPLKFNKLWESFSLQAQGGFVCRVVRSNTLFEQPRVVLDVNITDGTGYMRDLPYVFSKAKGKLHFEGDETRIDSLSMATGSDGSGRMTLNGVVRYPGGNLDAMQPELQVTADLPIEPRLLQALPVTMKEKISGLGLGGRVGFIGVLKRPVENTEPTAMPAGGSEGRVVGGLDLVQVAGDLHWRDGALKTEWSGVPLAFSGIDARATVSPTRVDMKMFKGKLALPTAGAQADAPRDAVTVKASGALDIETAAATLSVGLNGEKLTLPKEPPAALPADWAKLWSAYAPTGQLDVAASAAIRINGTPADKGTGPLQIAIDTYDALLTARDIGLSSNDWPEPLTRLRGDIRIKPGGVEMSTMTARAGPVSLDWSGSLDTATGKTLIRGNAVSAGVPTKWLPLLPDGLAKNIDTDNDDTTLTLHVQQLERAAPGKPWTFDGTLATEQFGLTAPLVIGTSRATIAARGTYQPADDKHPAALNMTGVLAATDMLVNDHNVDTVTAHLDVMAADKAIHISEIDGKIAGGAVTGRIDLYTGALPLGTTRTVLAAGGPTTVPIVNDEGGYLAELALKDAELSGLLLPPTATAEDKKKVGTGKVSATLELLETFGEKGERTGQGEMTVRDANIYNVPLSMGLIQMVTFRLPVAKAFHHANMVYTIHGDDIDFDRILLESNGINLAGTGTVTIKDKKMDLSFVTETPNEFFIPIISPIIRETRNELLQLSVSGTLDNPKVSPVPLSAISNTLRAFLPRQRVDNK